MIGARSFVAAMRNGRACSPFLFQNLGKASQASNNARLLSTAWIKPWPTQQHQRRRMTTTGSGKGTGSGSGSRWTLSSNLFAAAFGVALGFTGVKSMSPDGQNDNPFLQQATCAPGMFCNDKKCEDSDCLRKSDCEEQLIIKANGDLEKALKELKPKAVDYTEQAMKAYCLAIAAMKEYLTQGYCIIDDDKLSPPEYEEAWCCVYNVAKDRCAKVKDALEKGQCAWELLCRLRDVVEKGKACRFTSCNPLLVTAEEALVCAEKELQQLKAQFDCVSGDHPMIEKYAKVIENFKKELQIEVDAVSASGECKVCYLEQELALMQMMAYRKVVRAHKEVAQKIMCSGNLPERIENTLC